MAEDSRSYIQRYSCQTRVDTFGFNMFSDAWPTGYDAVLLTNVLHDRDPGRRAHLAEAAFDALPPGGQLLIHEILLNDAQDGPLAASIFSVMDISVKHTYGYYSLVRATK